jgi:LacI family transcriptional regulator
VIGVDNDEHICENTRPPLSSILPDNEQAGYDAAKMLDEIVGGAAPCRRFFGARMLAKRGSTQVFHISDQRVRRAVAFIRGEKSRGVSAEAVARFMGCTLRMSEILFKRCLGHSVRDEILDARIDLAKRLLADRRIGMSALADMCGYADGSSLRRVFLAKVGCSMSEWRRRPQV